MRLGTGVALVMAAGLLWSTQGLVIRQIEEAGSWAVLFWRSLGMVPVLLAFLALRAGGSPLPAIRRVGWTGALGGAGLVGAFGGAVAALQATTVADAVFLFAASPAFAALLGWAALRERVAPATWACIALALAGIFVMVRDEFGSGAAYGNAAALVSALGFAIFTVTLRRGRLHDTLPSVLLGALFSMVAGALAAALAAEPLAVPPGDVLWSLAMGAVTLSGGMVLYTLGSRSVPAAELALLALVEVLLAPVWVWLWLGEGGSPATFAGGGIVLLAVTLNGLLGARRPARA